MKSMDSWFVCVVHVFGFRDRHFLCIRRFFWWCCHHNIIGNWKMFCQVSLINVNRPFSFHTPNTRHPYIKLVSSDQHNDKLYLNLFKFLITFLFIGILFLKFTKLCLHKCLINTRYMCTSTDKVLMCAIYFPIV